METNKYASRGEEKTNNTMQWEEKTKKHKNQYKYYN